jgi:hypothetical protein
MKSTLLYGLFASAFLFTACGSSKPKYDGPSPVDMMMRDLSNEKSYSIILHDMQMDESKGVYEHKYKVSKDIENKDTKPETTGWKKVSEVFFAENLNNMGLELASKSVDGAISKKPSPPGFNGVVGNKKYGEWQTNSSGGSFWQFYGQYMFMSSMMNMMHRPVYYDSYNHYSSYRRTNPNAPYYGNGTHQYGTNSPATRASNPSFFERKQQQSQLSSFKQKVASNPARYSRAESSRSNDNGNNSRTPRSSSRTGSSSRSRGGSFGK